MIRLLPLALFACGLFEDSPSWRDQLEADSVCYEVDLLDGIDRSSTEELRGVFDCLDAQGHLAPLRPTRDRLERTLPSGRPLGLVALDAGAALGGHEIDLVALLDTTSALLDDPDDPVSLVVDLGLELATGKPAADVRAGLDLRDGELLERAPLATATSLPGVLARSMDRERLDAIADVLEHPDTPQWLRTAEAVVQSDDPTVTAAASGIVRDLGDALLATGAGTAEDTLRNAAETLLADPDGLVDLLGDAHPILADPTVRQSFERSLLRWHDDGDLPSVAAQVGWLASVNRSGDPLDRYEISALGAVLRLLHDTNRPLRCSIDVLIADVRLDLGNMALVVLDVLADLDADQAVDLTSFLGSVLDIPLSEFLLDQFASTGICPVLTPQVLDDLQTIEILDRPDAASLFRVMIDVLRLVRDGQDNHLARVADLATDLHDRELAGTVEVLARQLAPQPVIATILRMAPVLSRPEEHGLPRGHADLQDALDLLERLIAPAPNGSHLQRWLPVLTPLLRHPDLWTTMGAAATLMADRRSTLQQLPAQLPTLLALDPELDSLQTAAHLARDEDVTTPLLEILADEALTETLLAVRPQGDDPRVPIAWLAELATDGTLDELLSILGLSLDALKQTSAD